MREQRDWRHQCFRAEDTLYIQDATSSSRCGTQREGSRFINLEYNAVTSRESRLVIGCGSDCWCCSWCVCVPHVSHHTHTPSAEHVSAGVCEFDWSRDVLTVQFPWKHLHSCVRVCVHVCVCPSLHLSAVQPWLKVCVCAFTNQDLKAQVYRILIQQNIWTGLQILKWLLKTSHTLSTSCASCIAKNMI